MEECENFLVSLLAKAKYKISVFPVMGLKILGRVGTHIFFSLLFFFEKFNS